MKDVFNCLFSGLLLMFQFHPNLAQGQRKIIVGFPLPCRVSFILPGQLILLAFLVETNIFEASHVTFFSTN
jgi:hypothetical protein